MARDHGGGLDAAVSAYGGSRDDWIDLSTGINPVPYPVSPLPQHSWTALPDKAAVDALIAAARAFWSVPEEAVILPAPGASAIIASIPYLRQAGGRAHIPGPTYNEHAAALRASGKWDVAEDAADCDLRVLVHPNNPDGRLADPARADAPGLTIIDESFCDVCPDHSLVALTARPGTIVLKSFGKFWGLAGLRLGFAIGHPDTLEPKAGERSIAELLGPWAVSGPALAIGADALGNITWAGQTRRRLARDARRLDGLMTKTGADLVGGTDLFRLYDVTDAPRWQDRLGRHHIWTRIFPYSDRWIRLGLPAPEAWNRIEEALR